MACVTKGKANSQHAIHSSANINHQEVIINMKYFADRLKNPALRLVENPVLLMSL